MEEAAAPPKRAHKDSVFVDLFCRDEHGKENFLSLYNALHGTQLSLAETSVQDVSIADVLFTTQENDVSMLVDGRVVVLCEHQSTINENMPLRCLMYIARIYERLQDNRQRFKRRLQAVPAPEFHVLYNGREALAEETTLRLSDAFAATTGGGTRDFPLELCVTVHNLNKPSGRAAWERCKPLTEYTDFVKIIREEQRRGGGYMTRAVRRARRRGILTEYLSRKGKEVENMFIGEYDYETDVAVQREEAYEEGVTVGIVHGKQETARNLLRMGLTPAQVALGVGLPLADVVALAGD